MSTYYDENYIEVSEESLYELYDDMLDVTEEEITILGVTFSPSQIVSELDYDAYRQGFHAYTDRLMQDGELYESELEFIDLLLDEWLGDHIEGYSDMVDSFKFENLLLMEALELYSGGLLELVDGELQPHPWHSLEHLVADLMASVRP